MTITVILCFVAVLLFALLSLRESRRNKKKYEDLRQKVGIINHEIKNSLTAFQFAADEKSRENEIKRLSELTKDTSDFLKNPKGKPEKIELVSMLDDLSKHFSQNVKISRSQSKLYVMFDPEKARSVFENLIKNACESADGKDAKPEVEVLKQNKTAVVRVLDRGKGISEEDIGRIFDFCYTTKADGSGIGLPIVKYFVESQHGTVKLYSREGGGTVAEVVLPLSGEKNE